MLAHQLEHAGNAAGFSLGRVEGGAVADLPGQHAGDGHLAAMRGVERLEHRGDGLVARLDAETFGGVGHAGRFVAQRLHQPQHAVGTRRRTHQHRANQALAQFLGEIVEHLVARRLDIVEQLFHQFVVVIGQRLQHGEARGFLAIEHVAFERDDFGGSVLLVDERAFQCEIDEAGDDVFGKSRNLTQQQFGARRRLQHRKHVMNGGVGLVDLVEKQETGNLPLFQFAQHELELRDFLLVHLTYDDGGVDGRQHRAHVMDEFDGTRAIDKAIAVAHKIGGGDRHFDAHVMLARLFAGITDRSPRLHRTLALDGAGAGEDRFQKSGLAALEWAHQRDTPGTLGTCAVLSHCNLPCWPGAGPYPGPLPVSSQASAKLARADSVIPAP